MMIGFRGFHFASPPATLGLALRANAMVESNGERHSCLERAGAKASRFERLLSYKPPALPVVHDFDASRRPFWPLLTSANQEINSARRLALRVHLRRIVSLRSAGDPGNSRIAPD